MGKGMTGGDCGERGEGTVGKGMRGRDREELDGCGEGTVVKGMQGGDCRERDDGRGL